MRSWLLSISYEMRYGYSSILAFMLLLGRRELKANLDG